MKKEKKQRNKLQKAMLALKICFAVSFIVFFPLTFIGAVGAVCEWPHIAMWPLTVVSMLDVVILCCAPIALLVLFIISRREIENT